MTQAELRTRLVMLSMELDHLGIQNQDSLNHFKRELSGIINALPADAQSLDSPELKQQLKQSLAQFEADHPVIARTTEEVVESLSKMGI